MAVEVFLRGGLGNQLFQYAAGLYLSRKQGEDLVLRGDLLPLYPDAVANVSRWPVQITDFSSEGAIVSRSNQPPGATSNYSKMMQMRRMLGDRFETVMRRLGYIVGDKVNPSDFSRLNRIRVIDSYCASPQPASDLGDELRSQLLDLRRPSKEFTYLIYESRAETPINVHLRLGDYRYLTNLYGSADYGVLSEVVSEIRKSSDAPVWLFTDSPEDLSQKTLEKLSVKRVVGPKDLSTPLENLVALSSGSQLVCANSTFSWWSAFLKGPNGLVYYPRPKDSPLNIFTEDMVMPSWKAYGLSI
jgi:hypothetical protein